MGKDSGSKPPPPAPGPSPAAMAEAQGLEDRKMMKYSLAQSRTSTVNPFGSTTWKNNKTFDQAGFDAAMKDYTGAQAQQAQQAEQRQKYGAPGTPTAADPFAGLNRSFGAMTVDGENGNPIQGPAGPSPMDMLMAGMTPQMARPDRSKFEGDDSWTNTQTLSPESQGIYDTATAKLGEATKNISTDAKAYNQATADAVYNRLRRYQDPADARARSAQQSNMADRGFQVGNEAYNTEATRLDDSQAMGRADAADRAQVTGFDQGQRELTMQQQIASMLSNLRNQQVAGVSGMPTTTTTPSMQPFNIAGAMQQEQANKIAAYGNEMDSYNAENASDDKLLGSLLSMGGMALGVPGGGMLGGLLGGAMSKGGGASGGYSGGGFKMPAASGAFF